MSEQERLTKLSHLKNVSLLSSFIDEFTEIKCKCNVCQSVFEKFPERLLEEDLWCDQCQMDPSNIIEKILLSLNFTIKERKFKDMYDFLALRNNKKYLIYIATPSEDFTEQKNKANAVNIKLIVVYKNHVASNQEAIHKFIDESSQNTEKVSTYIPDDEEDDEPDEEDSQDVNRGDIEKMLSKAGFDKNNIIPIGLSGYSYYTKPILAPQNSKIVYGYVRVSTKMQSIEGNSIDTQVQTIKTYINSFNASNNSRNSNQPLHLRSIFIDFGISGRTVERRPALLKVLNDIRKNQVLICASLSRLCRNLRQSLKIYDDLKTKNCNLISCDISLDTDSMQGQMMFNLIASFAEMESKQIGERVSAVMKNLQEQGKLKHRPRYGFKFVGKNLPFERDEKEQAMIEYIKKLRVQKPDLTVSQLCRELNKLPEDQRGLRKGTKKWYESTLSRIMENNNIAFSRFDNRNEIVYEKEEEEVLYE